MKRVAVFGGSFAPVHKGHMAVARGILEQGLADEVWLMPCRRNPLKADSPRLNDELRLNLLDSAVEFYNSMASDKKGKLKVCDVELSMPVPSYTFNSMQKLASSMPDVDFRLVVGADSYQNFENWFNWEALEDNFHPIVYPRPGYDLLSVRKHWERLENVDLVDVSSTGIRQLLQKGELDIANMPWLEGNAPLADALLEAFASPVDEETKIK